MNATIRWRVLPLGEAALLVEGTPADDLTNRAVIALARALDAAALPGALPSVPAVSSLLIPFDPLRLPAVELEAMIWRLLAELAPAPDSPERVVEIAVRYGGADGPDLLDVAAQVGMTPQAVVALHIAPIYRVLLIGFAPGFPYLGPLPEPLRLPRRSTPRTKVPAGSVAIAADMSGIYPAVLPGGWHLLGRTEQSLFDPHADPPSLLEPGVGVRFVPSADGIQP
ncbi:MAG: 5-oxoprolinase subunit PxpB [Chloroflexi bacterium]|nr:5-oxoprolinase subunit PxpB [Chloroflexota bacterium]